MDLARPGQATQVEKAIFGLSPILLNLEVDLLFFDTTSTYFELDTKTRRCPGTKRQLTTTSRRRR